MVDGPWTGNRIIESTLRTMNNLLERLHASFFFYLLVGTTTFMKIGSYLPTAVLVSTAMLFSGLGHWVEARWVIKTEKVDHSEKGQQPADVRKSPAQVKWLSRRRHVLPALSIQIATHLVGVALFYVYTRPWFLSRQEVSVSSSQAGTPLTRLLEGSITTRICHPGSGPVGGPASAAQHA